VRRVGIKSGIVVKASSKNWRAQLGQPTSVIRWFSGSSIWLSNFYSCQIEFEGMVFPSLEAANQAAKSLSMETREVFQRLQANKSTVLGSGMQNRSSSCSPFRLFSLFPEYVFVRVFFLLCTCPQPMSTPQGMRNRPLPLTPVDQGKIPEEIKEN